MKKSHSSIGLFLVCLFITLTTSACGIRYNVKGQVLDAATGKPVEGAAVAVHWYKYVLSPYSSGYTRIESGGAVSNSNGYFKIPKYSFRHSELGIYKKGYVCWYSGRIFPKNFDGKGEYPERKGFDVENGMKIKLEPFTDEYPKYWHASFTTKDVATYCEIDCQGPFYKAIEDERKFYDKESRNREFRIKQEQNRSK